MDAAGDLQFGEQGALTDQDWADVLDQEHEPFGPIGHRLTWRPKDRHVTLRAGDGHLVAVAGALVAEVRVAGGPAFDVVGVGGLIVMSDFRGRGLMTKLVEPLLRVARTLGPDRAMLFCAPELVGLYGRFEFAQIAAPVRVDQLGGPIEMPEPAMWRALREGAHWPPGRVEVPGLPF